MENVYLNFIRHKMLSMIKWEWGRWPITVHYLSLLLCRSISKVILSPTTDVLCNTVTADWQKVLGCVSMYANYLSDGLIYSRTNEMPYKKKVFP